MDTDRASHRGARRRDGVFDFMRQASAVSVAQAIDLTPASSTALRQAIANSGL